MEQRKTKNAVIYVRSAIVDQQSGESLNAQVERCMSFAKK
jgi:hypothetical protein